MAAIQIFPYQFPINQLRGVVAFYPMTIAIVINKCAGFQRSIQSAMASRPLGWIPSSHE